MKLNVTIKQGNVGLLFEDGVLTRSLEPGRYTVGKLFGPPPAIVTTWLAQAEVRAKDPVLASTQNADLAAWLAQG